MKTFEQTCIRTITQNPSFILSHSSWKITVSLRSPTIKIGVDSSTRGFIDYVYTSGLQTGCCDNIPGHISPKAMIRLRGNPTREIKTEYLAVSEDGRETAIVTKTQLQSCISSPW